MWNKNNVFLKIWSVIYPIFIYYAVSNVVMYFAILVLGVTAINYASNYTILQTIATVVALPVIWGYYRRDKLLLTVFHQRMENSFTEIKDKKKVLDAVGTFVCGALAGIVLNNIIGATGLTEVSSGYQEVTTNFFAGNVLVEIIGVGILVPVVEELLYRGVVYARLADWIGIWKATVISALIFGGLHFNVVQFIYACLMGFLLVYFFEKTHSLAGAILGHIGANLITVLRVEYGVLNWMENSSITYWVSTIVMAVICVIMIGIMYKTSGGEKVA